MELSRSFPSAQSIKEAELIAGYLGRPDNALPALNDYEARQYGSTWQVFKNGSTDPVKTDLPDRIAANKWIASQRRAMAA